MSSEEHKLCMNLTKVRRVYGERAEYIEVGLVSIIFPIFLNIVLILDHYHKSNSFLVVYSYFYSYILYLFLFALPIPITYYYQDIPTISCHHFSFPIC